MNNYLHETTHDKKTGCKKLKLIIILSLLFSTALSTYSFAERSSVARTPPDCEAITDSYKTAGNVIGTNIKLEYIRSACYSRLRELLRSTDREKKYNHSATPRQPGDPWRYFLSSNMGALLSNTRNSVKEQYASAYWDTFDLLFAYTDIKEQEPFYYLMRYGSGEIMFYPQEALYLTARFLSREDTVRKLMENSKQSHYIHKLRLANTPKLKLLIPFGLPLTLLDTFQLSSSLDYYDLRPEQKDELTDKIPGFEFDFEVEVDSLRESLAKNLGHKSFINDHKTAHRYLIAQLLENAVKSKETIGRGAIPVLNSSARKKTATGGKSPLFMYSVITMDMLREALILGLNPNTLISGIAFEWSILEGIVTPGMSQLKKSKKSISLLEWAAKGNIQGAGSEDAVEMLIKAGANPHALPEEGWSKVKQRWLKKWQEKIDKLDLPGRNIKYELHEMMLFDPQAPVARFMRNYQEYLNETLLSGPKMIMEKE